MITIYNKIDKSREDTTGYEVVPSFDSVERPFLMCLSAQNNYSKSIYGMMREGAQAARLLTSQGVGGRFKANDFPIDILGVRFKRDDKYHQEYTELADRFIYPFLFRRGRDVEQIKKQARKMNFITYCDGAITYKEIEDRLEVLLKRDGYSETDIHDILSNVSLVALETNVETGSLHATSVAFVDVNDDEIESSKSDSYKELLQSQPYSSMFAPLGQTNGILYIYDGRGFHNVKEFFRDGNIAKPAVSSVVSLFLENSLKNEHCDEVVPIEIADVLNQLSVYADESVSPKELLDKLDKELSYDGAPRYTEGEAKLRMELDDVYKTLTKTNSSFIRTLKEKEGQETRLKSVIRGIHEFSSDVTFEQILTYAHMWQSIDEQDLLSIPSDKQVRATLLADENNYDSQKRATY